MEDALLHAHDAGCLFVLRVLLRVALLVDEHRRHTPRKVRRWIGSLRRVVRAWIAREDRRVFVPCPNGRPAWNRTMPEVEDKVVRLHVEHPELGAGQLRWLAERVLGFRAARETFRKILIRRRDLVAALEQKRRRAPHRIFVDRPRRLWGADLTLVWILGIFPVWIFGLVDYHGSNLLAFERLAWPTSAEIVRVFRNAVAEHGAPDRILTDRGSVFRAEAFEAVLADHGVRHTLTRPAHPWTNGRIERIFRTFKSTVFRLVWLLATPSQVDRFCSDFLTWHNRDRPHAAWDGRTPDEVFFGREKLRRSLGRVDYFDGRMHWYRFG